MCMPIESKIEQIPESTDGKLVMEFSNGSLQQLKDLADFFKIKNQDPAKVVEVGISFLEAVRENAKKAPESKDS